MRPPSCVNVRVRMERVWSSPYTYFCPFEGVEEGDPVIVPFGADNRMALGKIVEVDVPESFRERATKYIAAYADLRAHHMRTALGVPKLTKGRTKK